MSPYGFPYSFSVIVACTEGFNTLCNVDSHLRINARRWMLSVSDLPFVGL